MDTSPNYAAKFANITATAVTSVTTPPPPPPHPLSPFHNQIDQVGMATLRDVMQTSFEDGARRDRRLWIGTPLLYIYFMFVSCLLLNCFIRF